MSTETPKIQHAAGNTWCLDAGCSIPVCFLDERTVVFLDSGYFDERTRPVLTAFLEDPHQLDPRLPDAPLSVRAVLTSHSHIDHVGSHIFLRDEYGAELILPETEAALSHDTRMFSPVYGQMAAKEIQKLMPYMIFQADRTFPETQETIDIDGPLFTQVPLPGHTPGHTGFVTPDDVLYVADALMGPEIMSRAKMPTMWDIAEDLASKERLLKEHCASGPRDACDPVDTDDTSGAHAAYILAHRGVWDSKGFRQLVQDNIADRNRRTNDIMGWLTDSDELAGREDWTLEGIQHLLWTKLGLRTKNPLRQRIFGRNVFCIVNYLVQSGRLESVPTEGVVHYRPVAE